METLKRRKIADKTARCIITIGGSFTIFIVLALFFFILSEVHPLFKSAKVLEVASYSAHGKVVFVDIDEYQETAYTVYQDGRIEFISLSDNKIVKRYHITNMADTSSEVNQSPGNNHTVPAAGLSPETNHTHEEPDEELVRESIITSVYKDQNRLVLGMYDGSIMTVFITFSESYEDGRRIITPQIAKGETLKIDEKGQEIQHVVSKSDDRATITVASTTDNRLLVKHTEVRRTLFGTGEKTEFRKDLTHLVNQSPSYAMRESSAFPSGITEPEDTVKITSLAIDSFMENLYAGTSTGKLIHINIRDKKNPFVHEIRKISDKAITVLGFVLGDITLIACDQEGAISSWMQVRKNNPAKTILKKIHTFQPHTAQAMTVVPSKRNKSFLTMAYDGTIHLSHTTSRQTILSLRTQAEPTAIAFSPRGNGILVACTDNTLYHWNISNPHPEITLKTLFGRIWYEGYEKPEFIWQSTGGAGDYEPKLSLVPLIFGTIKGTLYSLVIAMPIGILAALYTSQFLHRRIKFIKPAIEIMAALPSVILGFLAALWFAPLIESIFPAIVIAPLFIVLFTAIALFSWGFLPDWIQSKYRYGIEALFLIPFLIGAVYVSIQLTTISESILFQGDYRHWLLSVLGLHYDQRNALIVGFAMGFAIIPVIFTISEDALSNVPANLSSASLALGATPWQTAVRVVLPTASPGIFSAVMIGFGRAVGETMIVLMATGNTPIMDWNPFNGFRALSANIAVEIPEAPIGGTLYRVLFFAALLLFITTFIVNTASEMVRQRMRKKYSKL